MTEVTRVGSAGLDSSRGAREGDDGANTRSLPSTAFSVIGLGASAGGMAAFKAFFSGLPSGSPPNLAFVVVQHLAPDQPSLLPQLLQRCTTLRVLEVTEGLRVEPNCVYVAPPNGAVALANGVLRLVGLQEPSVQRHPIDFFFHTLAREQRERAVCIVLSGTGSDGSQGLRDIKREGGLVLVQRPESAEYDGMPRSAIWTGLVDKTLPPAEMPARVVAHLQAKPSQRYGVQQQVAPQEEAALQQALSVLCRHSGHDFSQYKPRTLFRRLARRMAAHQIDTIDGYVKYLESVPSEAQQLLRELLIGVTRFFRDPEAFAALEQQVIPVLISSKTSSGTLRVWVPGCSTGEEAYSLAILILEQAKLLNSRCRIQIFATDLEAQSIATARAGIYPNSIDEDVSPERLAQHFLPVPEGGGYQVHKRIRDLVIFSEQDLTRDPPLARLDLISCRNLLIYMGGTLQQKIVSLFHYSLCPGGYLFLGVAETVAGAGDLFAPVDVDARIYRRQNARNSLLNGKTEWMQNQESSTAPRPSTWRPSTEKKSLRQHVESALLRQVVPPCALVDEQGNILYLHGRTGRMLEPPPGVAGASNIISMAREGLRGCLVMALENAKRSPEEVVRCWGIRVQTNTYTALVNLAVRRLETSAQVATGEPLYLVTLEECLEQGPSVVGNEDQNTVAPRVCEPVGNWRVQVLQRDVQLAEERLRQTNEALNTANEELSATNEQVGNFNEELQSINEELATVNAELQVKVGDLSQASQDMQNVLASTGVPILFVDRKLRVVRFTPAMTQIVNLIPGDVGRFFGHIGHNLVGYTTMVADTQSVLNSLVAKEIDVQHQGGASYLLRIAPYRRMDSVVEGASLTFSETTPQRNLQLALRESEGRLKQFMAAVPDLLWICQPNGQCDYLSPRWTEYTGLEESSQSGLGWLGQIHADDVKLLTEPWRCVPPPADLPPLEVRVRDQFGDYRWFEMRIRPCQDPMGHTRNWWGFGGERGGPGCPGSVAPGRASAGAREAGQ